MKLSRSAQAYHLFLEGVLGYIPFTPLFLRRFYSSTLLQQVVWQTVSLLLRSMGWHTIWMRFPYYAKAQDSVSRGMR
jgi:hypothetical protein